MPYGLWNVGLNPSVVWFGSYGAFVLMMLLPITRMVQSLNPEYVTPVSMVRWARTWQRPMNARDCGSLAQIAAIGHCRIAIVPSAGVVEAAEYIPRRPAVVQLGIGTQLGRFKQVEIACAVDKWASLIDLVKIFADPGRLRLQTELPFQSAPIGFQIPVVALNPRFAQIQEAANRGDDRAGIRNASDLRSRVGIALNRATREGRIELLLITCWALKRSI